VTKPNETTGAEPASALTNGLEREFDTEKEMDMETDKLIDAATAQADLYEDDDRQDIKTDVMNAFFAGAKFGWLAEREACANLAESFKARNSDNIASAIRARSNAVGKPTPD
jgi:hypothetical protein